MQLAGSVYVPWISDPPDVVAALFEILSLSLVYAGLANESSVEVFPER